MTQTHTVSVMPQQGILFWVIRIAYFLLIGLWLSAIWAAVAWVLSITIIGLPLGLWMLSKLPQITTLRPNRQDFVIHSDGSAVAQGLPQRHFLLRASYFILIGWWFSGLWLLVAWAIAGSWIGLPIAFWMFNQVPAVMTLART